MPPSVHPTASVSPTAILHDGVRIGPYCVVGPDVRIGADTILEAHVVLSGHTELGSSNHLFPFTCLGMPPQDLKYNGEPTHLVVGDGNIIREYVTMNTGTARGGGFTRVGNKGLFMAHTHVAHDCSVADHVVMANGAALAGHVEVGAHVVFGGMAGVHQFARVGAYAFVAAGAMVTQDVPPFTCVQGDRARLRGLNQRGLVRAGMSGETLRALKQAYRLLFRSGLTRAQAIARLEAEFEPMPEISELISFVKASRRGVCRSCT